MRNLLHFLTLIVAIALFAACADSTQDADDTRRERGNRAAQDEGERDRASPWRDVNHAVCVVVPTSGNTCSGVVRFESVAEGIRITADISGLSPNATHAFHIHEFGDLTADDGTSAGDHYNPEGHEHGLPDEPAESRHAGDLGNLTADAQGNAHYEITMDNITFGRRNAIVGRSIIIHEGADDGGQPTGNAGARIGMGVIGVTSAPQEEES